MMAEEAMVHQCCSFIHWEGRISGEGFFVPPFNAVSLLTTSAASIFFCLKMVGKDLLYQMLATSNPTVNPKGTTSNHKQG